MLGSSRSESQVHDSNRKFVQSEFSLPQFLLNGCEKNLSILTMVRFYLLFVFPSSTMNT